MKTLIFKISCHVGSPRYPIRQEIPGGPKGPGGPGSPGVPPVPSSRTSIKGFFSYFFGQQTDIIFLLLFRLIMSAIHYFSKPFHSVFRYIKT